MQKFKVTLLETYQIDVEVEAYTADEAKESASFLTDGIVMERIEAHGGAVRLSRQEFRTCVPAMQLKGKTHKSKQKKER